MRQGSIVLLVTSVLAVLRAPIHAADDSSLAMPDNVLRAMRDDASLCEVSFVDRRHGWAVGDRGTIWHTSDGGARWELQESGVFCRLTSVQFVDAQHGWTAGGWAEPFSHVSRGVLLRTRDGGRTWAPLPQQLMGSVLRLKFIDARRGWALCVPNGLCPGGVLTTDDGGQDWTPVPQQTLHPWTCGDSVDALRGGVAADGGTAAAVERGEFQPVRFDSGLRRPAAMRLLHNGRGYLIGEGMLLLTTRDGGAHWEAPAGALPIAATDVNLSAIALKDNHVWLAGSPGLSVFHSADNGATWESHATGTTLPLAALSFVNAEHGWAVGALGQILATADGGRTWKPQRGRARSAAYLAVFGETSDVPLEALARLSAAEGYRGVVSIIARRDLESPLEPPLLSRLRQKEALLLAGAGEVMAAWQFPLRQEGISRPAAGIIEDWQRTLGDADPMARLEAHLVRDLRCWCPDIVLTQADAGEAAPLPGIVSAALLRAVKRAADPNYPGGLRPWQVRRVLAVQAAQRRGALTVSGSQILPQLGRSLAEIAAPARGVLSTHAEAATASVPFVVVWDESPGEAVRDFFSGVPTRAGLDSRRAALPESPTSLEEMRRMAQRRQLLQAIVTRREPASGNRAAWLAQIGTLTRDLDETSAALLLYQLGCHYRSAGQWDLAAETFVQVVEKYPAQSGLAAASSLWLLQYYGSGELTVRADREGRFPVRLVRADQPAAEGRPACGPASLIPATEEDAPRAKRPVPAPADEAADATDEPAAGSGAARRKLAAEWAHRLEAISNQLAAEPRSLLPAGRALAASEAEDKSQRLMMGLMRSRAADAWSSCAAAEHWLVGAPAQRAPAPKPVLQCRSAAQKPRLDGKLDDACWRDPDGAELPGVGLRSALGDDAGWPAVVQLAYDQEFLYLAATCRQAPGVKYPAATEPRQRDADLAGHDRIAVTLDIDRDWTSYWRLAIDHRGQTADDCWGDRTWNPKWFVAAARQETTWTCEAAIPWAELASRPPQRGEAWAMGIERVVPGVGFQSWTTPAAAATVRPEGFGLLIFQ